MPCSKNNNNTHHTRHTHAHILTAGSLALISGALYFRQRFSWLCSWLYWLVLPRPSCLSRRRRRTLLLLRPLSFSLALSMRLLSQPVHCHMFALLSPVRSVSPVTTLTVILTITMRAITAAKPLTYKVTMLLAAPTSPWGQVNTTAVHSIPPCHAMQRGRKRERDKQFSQVFP